MAYGKLPAGVQIGDIPQTYNWEVLPQWNLKEAALSEMSIPGFTIRGFNFNDAVLIAQHEGITDDHQGLQLGEVKLLKPPTSSSNNFTRQALPVLLPVMNSRLNLLIDNNGLQMPQQLNLALAEQLGILRQDGVDVNVALLTKGDHISAAHYLRLGSVLQRQGVKVCEHTERGGAITWLIN